MKNNIENEIKTADEVNIPDGDVYIHKFRNPFEFEGVTYNELTFNWGKLTGADSLAIENEMLSLGRVLINPKFSGEYLTRMAAKACDKPIGDDAVKAMPLADFNRIHSAAQAFLTASEQ